MTYEILKGLASKGFSRKQMAKELDVKFDTINNKLRKFKIATTGFESTVYSCICGETKRECFYGKQKSACKKCQIKKTHERLKALKIKAIEYKGGKCEKCGYDKCTAALEFHHTNPLLKDLDPSKALTRSWENAKKELDKCILICSNCHREIHQE